MANEDMVIEDELLSNDEAVTLFNSSLKKALKEQSETIVSTIVKQITKTPVVSSAKEAAFEKFEFKHEGHKIQHNFNEDRLKKLDEIEQAIKNGDIDSVLEIIEKEKAELKQRNKILKIADRHGWDTVHEYLDDPLADDNDDAAKLRGAVNRAARKRNFRYKPYGQKPGAFNKNEFFRGFSNTANVGSAFRQPYRASNDQKCFYCRQPGQIVRDCPHAKSQQVPVPPSQKPAASGSASQ